MGIMKEFENFNWHVYQSLVSQRLIRHMFTIRKPLTISNTRTWALIITLHHRLCEIKYYNRKTAANPLLIIYKIKNVHKIHSHKMWNINAKFIILKRKFNKDKINASYGFLNNSRISISIKISQNISVYNFLSKFKRREQKRGTGN